MLRRTIMTILAALLAVGLVSAQDGLNLPTELYVLTNTGMVQRYGLGMAGVSAVTPEDTFVIDFGVAPDGNWLAYRTDQSLELLNMYSGESSTVEGATAGLPPFRGRGDTMAWSPTGDALAYTTLYGARVWFNTSPPVFLDLRQGAFEQIGWSPDGAYLAAEAEPDIWWIYRRDGLMLTLTSAIPSSKGLAWVGPAEVVFAPEDGGLFQMNLAAGNQQTLLLDNTWVYQLPYKLPDGTLAVFGRQKSDTDTQPGFGRLLGLAPDAPRVSSLGNAAVDLTDLRWAPRGELMVAFRGGVLALVVPGSGQGLTLPVSDAAAYSWGAAPLPTASSLQLPTDGYFLTDDENGVAQVWRMPADGTQPVQLTAATADVTAYALSPDGQQLAYATADTLWLQPLNSAGEAQSLSEFDGRDVYDIMFSPDGQRIAFATSSSDDQPEGGIWVQAVDNDTPAGLIQPNGPETPDSPVSGPPFYRAPAFAPDGVALLVRQNGSETTAFRLLSEAGNDVTRRDLGQYDAALWLRDGRILAYGDGMDSGDPPPAQLVVVINPADGAPTPLASIPYPAQIVTARDIAPGQVRLVLRNMLPGPRALNVVDLRTDTGALSAVGSGGFMVNPTLSPDGDTLAGQTHDGGPLTVRDLSTGQQTVLAAPLALDDYRWATIR
ncbi:MAG: PD40 domain-containing protein [Chloroflexi bacterium]|nr:PD40 domain-containing protein [Chloroflexota bacterium]